MSLLELFCDVDDFCQAFWKEEPKQLVSKTGQRLRQSQLSESEIMTIMIHFHQSAYRDFKDYYTKHVQVYLKSEFPDLVVTHALFNCCRVSSAYCGFTPKRSVVLAQGCRLLIRPPYEFVAIGAFHAIVFSSSWQLVDNAH
jgi:hypothetical protein